jgi:Lrp/AsnC family transcriptional regulator
VIRGQVTLLDRKKVGVEHADLRRSEAQCPRALELRRVHRGDPRVPRGAGVLRADGVGGFLLRIVTPDIEAYERFFFEKLSNVPGIQEVNSIVALSEIKSTTSLPLTR